MKNFKALVINRQKIVRDLNEESGIVSQNPPGIWVKRTGRNIRTVRSHLQRQGYLTVLLFEEDSERHMRLKDGVFKNFKKKHQKN